MPILVQALTSLQQSTAFDGPWLHCAGLELIQREAAGIAELQFHRDLPAACQQDDIRCALWGVVLYVKL